jgi:hypothetical protein
MSASMAFACFVAGAAAFLRFFYLAFRLNRERVGPPASKLQRLFPWLPGQFTPAGEKLRKQMNVLLGLGWIFLVAGLVLSPG